MLKACLHNGLIGLKISKLTKQGCLLWYVTLRNLHKFDSTQVAQGFIQLNKEYLSICFIDFCVSYENKILWTWNQPSAV